MDSRRVLIDIGHPAHIHFFKNFIWKMKEKGHEIRISAREKDVTLELLETYGLPYKNRGKLHGLVMGKAVDMVRINHKIHTIAKEFNPHIMMGVHNPYSTSIGQ